MKKKLESFHAEKFLAGRSTMALGCNIDRIEWNIESIELKFANMNNREGGSDIVDFWTESIVSTQLIYLFKFSNERKLSNRSNLSIGLVGRLIVSIDGRLDHGWQDIVTSPSKGFMRNATAFYAELR